MRQQLEYFREYKERLTVAKGVSEADEIIAGALYYFSIGNNDIGVNYFLLPQRRAQFSPPEYAAFLVGIAGGGTPFTLASQVCSVQIQGFSQFASHSSHAHQVLVLLSKPSL